MVYKSLTAIVGVEIFIVGRRALSLITTKRRRRSSSPAAVTPECSKIVKSLPIRSDVLDGEPGFPIVAFLAIRVAMARAGAAARHVYVANAGAARALVVVHSNAGGKAVGKPFLRNKDVADVRVLDARIQLPALRWTRRLHVYVPTSAVDADALVRACRLRAELVAYSAG